MTHSTLKSFLLMTGAACALSLAGCEQTTRSTAPGQNGQTASTPQPNPDDTPNAVDSKTDAPIAMAAQPVIQQASPSTEERAAQMLTGTSNQPTVQQAKEFLESSAEEIESLNEYASRVLWVNANFLTDDTNWLASKVLAEHSKMITRLSNSAKRFNGIKLPADMARKMDILRRGSSFPAPEVEGASEELAEIETALNTAYSTGKFAYRSNDEQFASFYEGLEDGDAPELTLGQLSDIIAKSRNPEELTAVWEGWRTISPQMKDDYVRMVEIINSGAQELGFNDTGALWRSGYDMPADEFTAESDRLWGQVKPLYDELHCYVRAELNGEYGDDIVPLDTTIRADLLGNMWGQSWGNIYDIVKPDTPSSNIDLTALLENADYTPKQMVETGEAFFTSMGFEALPETFWERSLITKPADREVTCHASAWDIDDKDDIRIKMCTKVNGEDFQTVHHELGHNFYQRAYKNQSIYYKDGANDGFHEAIGDMIALSITPDYLVKIGLLDADAVPSAEGDIDLLMQQALEKIAFLPFGLMVDQWRWKVFSGEYSPDEYNSGWWELREQYQGLRPPVERTDANFDPGAKYHIPGNTPYMRYFLAHILQFQFHQAACEIAGYEGPIHRCSVYGNTEVGERFDAMMQMGASKPWPDALEAFTGTREMDGSAILAYFAPLLAYLKEQNKDRTCGW